MAEFTINDEDLTSLKGKVIVLTGGSSGIGLASVNLFLSLGATVVSGDIQPHPAPGPADNNPASFTFVKTDVTSWTDLCTLFATAKEVYGRIDCVLANAGIGPRADYLALETGDKGELKEPNHVVLDVNFKSVVNAACLGTHYMKQQPEGGSIVLVGSSTSFHGVRALDYGSAKAGTLGFGRGYALLMANANLPIRVNVLAPSWTSTQVFPDVAGVMALVSHRSQEPLVVARAAAYFMVDVDRNGDVVYVADGKYKEVDKAILMPAYEAIRGKGNPSDDEILGRIYGLGAL
ncbi:hypothetical protein ACMFMG_003781 [Clarireedia jacksonii]